MDIESGWHVASAACRLFGYRVPLAEVHIVFADSNFAPVILANGSLVALTRGAVVHGADWRDVKTYKQVV